MAEEGKRGRGRPKKAEFADLDAEFQDSVNNLSEQEIRDLVAKTAMQEAENIKNMKEDQHLAECKIQVKDASKNYHDNTKANGLKIRFLKRALEDKGKATV